MASSHFDERAATWDDEPGHVERAGRVADAIRATIALAPSTRLLEYGAGTGLVTQALRADIGPVTLADASAGMRDVMERKVAAGALTGARVWDLDLAHDPVPDESFDLVVTVLVLHHIPTLEPVLDGFAQLLVDGGHLCVADLEAEDGSFHSEGFEGHHGFVRDELRGHLERAGFADVTFTPCGEVQRPNGTFPMFLATARRAVNSG
jgi:predicted TPR repeat methyltransferase